LPGPSGLRAWRPEINAPQGLPPRRRISQSFVTPHRAKTSRDPIDLDGVRKGQDRLLVLVLLLLLRRQPGPGEDVEDVVSGDQFHLAPIRSSRGTTYGKLRARLPQIRRPVSPAGTAVLVSIENITSGAQSARARPRG